MEEEGKGPLWSRHVGICNGQGVAGQWAGLGLREGRGPQEVDSLRLVGNKAGRGEVFKRFL